MAHTFTKNHLHAVFSTKNRQKLIAEDFQPRLWKYVTGICQNTSISFRLRSAECQTISTSFFIFLQAAAWPRQCESSRQILRNG